MAILANQSGLRNSTRSLRNAWRGGWKPRMCLKALCGANERQIQYRWGDCETFLVCADAVIGPSGPGLSETGPQGNSAAANRCVQNGHTARNFHWPGMSLAASMKMLT